MKAVVELKTVERCLQPHLLFLMAVRTWKESKKMVWSARRGNGQNARMENAKINALNVKGVQFVRING